MKKSIAACALFLSMAAPLDHAASLPIGERVPVTSRPFERFKFGSDETRFGQLEFIGGIEMTSSNALLGAVSSIRFRPDGKDFLAVLDTGHWVEGAIRRDEKGRLSGLSDLTVTSMMDGNGRSEQVKSLMDSEGVALRDGQVLVGYEGKHRVDVHPDPGFAHSGPRESLPILIPRRELRINRGLETVAVSPNAGPLGGGVVVVAELSLDENGNLFAAVLDGPRQGIFSVARDGHYAVTDGAFLPDGDLLLLERRFNFADGLGMQIRRIKADAIRPGATVEGAVIMQADMGYQIDNMEGLDIIAGPDGDTRVIVVSDDNHSILERNLMLEFRLVE